MFSAFKYVSRRASEFRTRSTLMFYQTAIIHVLSPSPSTLNSLLSWLSFRALNCRPINIHWNAHPIENALYRDGESTTTSGWGKKCFYVQCACKLLNILLIMMSFIIKLYCNETSLLNRFIRSCICTHIVVLFSRLTNQTHISG